MNKVITSTGLVRVECQGQVWFERPGYTEIIFPRIHIEHRYELSSEGIFREDSKSSQPNASRRRV